MPGRPSIRYQRIIRIFPECLEHLEDPTLTPAEQQARQIFIQYCFYVCSIFPNWGNTTPDNAQAAAAEGGER